MQRAELKQISGIGDAICEQLTRNHGIETITDLAALSDTEVDELERALRTSLGNVRIGDVARWRDLARQLVRDREAVRDDPLATFVVEARKPVDEASNRPLYVVHHIESDQTLETSVPEPTIEDAVRWMEDRVTVPSAPPQPEPPTEGQKLAQLGGPAESIPSSPERFARRGRLRITGLEVHHAGEHVINGSAILLLARDPVASEGEAALVFVGHVSLEGTEEPVTCQLSCRLQRIESDQEVAFTWGGEVMRAPGMRSVTISSAAVSVPPGTYRGLCFAEDRGRAARRAFRELPLLVVS